MEGKMMRQVEKQPCAACRMLRRRCDSNCILAPYFPADDIDKFVGVHRVFGASNVIKMIQMVEETKRDDAVKSIVYEALARVRDPVYGSAGAIMRLQKMIDEVKMELQTMEARVSHLKQQIDLFTNTINPVININDPFVFDHQFDDTLSSSLLDPLIHHYPL